MACIASPVPTIGTCGFAQGSLRLAEGSEPPVPDVRSPTLRRRELGTLLRARRLELGLTVEQVAERLLCSPSKVSRMETGQRSATQRDVRDLCDLYRIADEEERGRLMMLAAESKHQGWWQSYDLDFSTYVGLEAAAVALKYYQTSIVPGLFQTADYARAMIEVSIPWPSPERIEELLEVKLKRQRILEQTPPLEVWAMLDEAALHRLVGGSSVMARQLERLTELASTPNVKLQVIAYGAGAHAAMDSTFNILDFAGSVPSVVYVEGLVGKIYLDHPRDIDRYQQVFMHLREKALSPKESIKLIAEIADKYR
jgi:transcriptional regulator with XRE-family HTH domain